MTKRITALLLAILVFASLAMTAGCSKEPAETVPSGTTTSPTQTTVADPTTLPTETTVPPTTVPPTTAPPETTVPPTTAPPPTTVPPATNPPSTGGEMIGSLYTRDQLMAMENNGQGYGPGSTKDGVRPGGASSYQSRYGQYGGNFIGEDNGKIYLTFDCGYEYTATDANGQQYRVTERILDVLKEKDVKAVFFVTMYYCKMNPDLVQRMISEGHVVGNHSNNHPVMPDISIDKMVYEVMSLHDYVEANFGYKMTLFRPPTGEFSTRSLALVQSLGYKNVHWSFAYVDWETNNQPEPTSALNKIVGHHHSGAIYLLHAVSTTNAAVLSDAIDQFRSLGYELALFQ